MTRPETALEYLRCFCRNDLEAMEPLLSEDLRWRGPFARFDTRADYLAALRCDPPAPGDLTVRAILADGDHVAVFYTYEKPGVSAEMAQLFNFRDGLIREMLLVFDGRDFA